MPTDTDRQPTTPWYRRGKAMIVSAGALAAAGLAVFGFWDRIFPPDVVDSAKIESVDVVGASTLDHFAFAGTSFPLEPASHAAGSGPVDVVAALTTSAPAPPAPPPVDPTANPSDSGPGPSSTPPETVSPSPTPPEITPPATPGTTSEPTIASLAKRWPPPQDLIRAVVADPALKGSALDGAQLSRLYVLGIDFVGPGGEPITPHDVAKNLKDSLDATDAGSQDPLGWTVAVDLSVEGLDGIPLLLTWSLDGTNVPVSWSTPNVAYRVVAATPRDAGSARIWVPNLKMPGAYRVNVMLVRESDGAPIAHGKPVELPNP